MKIKFEITYYQNKNIKSLASLDDEGRVHGLKQWFNKDGLVLQECKYENGIPYGFVKMANTDNLLNSLISNHGLNVNFIYKGQFGKNMASIENDGWSFGGTIPCPQAGEDHDAELWIMDLDNQQTRAVCSFCQTDIIN